MILRDSQYSERIDMFDWSVPIAWVLLVGCVLLWFVHLVVFMIIWYRGQFEKVGGFWPNYLICSIGWWLTPIIMGVVLGAVSTHDAWIRYAAIIVSALFVAASGALLYSQSKTVRALERQHREDIERRHAQSRIPHS